MLPSLTLQSAMNVATTATQMATIVLSFDSRAFSTASVMVSAMSLMGEQHPECAPVRQAAPIAPGIQRRTAPRIVDYTRRHGRSDAALPTPEAHRSGRHRHRQGAPAQRGRHPAPARPRPVHPRRRRGRSQRGQRRERARDDRDRQLLREHGPRPRRSRSSTRSGSRSRAAGSRPACRRPTTTSSRSPRPSNKLRGMGTTAVARLVLPRRRG